MVNGNYTTAVASEAGYSGGFTASACSPANIVVIQVATSNSFYVEPHNLGTCTFTVSDTLSPTDDATVTVNVNNNAVIISGKARK